MTRQPADENLFTVAWPIPREAPVSNMARRGGLAGGPLISSGVDSAMRRFHSTFRQSSSPRACVRCGGHPRRDRCPEARQADPPVLNPAEACRLIGDLTHGALLSPKRFFVS